MPNWKNKIIANSRASTQQSKHLTAGEASWQNGRKRLQAIYPTRVTWRIYRKLKKLSNNKRIQSSLEMGRRSQQTCLKRRNVSDFLLKKKCSHSNTVSIICKNVDILLLMFESSRYLKIACFACCETGVLFPS